MKENQTKDTDILIIGCGIAGLTASQSFSNLGYRCICIDHIRKTILVNQKNDFRSTAFLNNSIKVFKENDLWDDLENIGQPLEKMEIFCLQDNKVTQKGSFKSIEIGEKEFGFNLPNHELKKVLISKLKNNRNVELIFNKSLKKILFRSSENICFFSENLIIKSKLIIAADGYNSKVREICELNRNTNYFDQKALVFSVFHKRSHDNGSYEFYKDSGSLTLVPLKDKNKSAVILMDKSETIDGLLTLKKNIFNEELKKRTNNLRGSLDQTSKLESYLIKSHYINKLYSHRIAFIGEAAHSMPPIGAQGLNTSFADIMELEKIFKSKEYIKDITLCENNLKKYNRLRFPVVLSTIQAVNSLNWVARSKNEIIQLIRNKTLNLLSNKKSLKELIIKLGSQKFLPLSK